MIVSGFFWAAFGRQPKAGRGSRSSDPHRPTHHRFQQLRLCGHGVLACADPPWTQWTQVDNRVAERCHRQSSGYRRRRLRPPPGSGAASPSKNPISSSLTRSSKPSGTKNSILRKTWDSPFLPGRTRFTMDCVPSANPVAIAWEHLPMVDALDRGDAELTAALLASHWNPLVDILRSESPLHHDALHSHSKEPPDEPAFPLASRLGHRHRAICGDAGWSGRQTESNGPRARRPWENDY